MRKNIYYILALLVHELHWLNALANSYIWHSFEKKDNFKPLSFVSTYKSKNQFDLSLALFRTWLWALYIRFNQVSGSHQSTGTSDAVSYNHFRLFRFFDPLDKNGYLPLFYPQWNYQVKASKFVSEVYITWVFVFQKYDQFLKRFHSNIMELFPTQKKN